MPTSHHRPTAKAAPFTVLVADGNWSITLMHLQALSAEAAADNAVDEVADSAVDEIELDDEAEADPEIKADIEHERDMDVERFKDDVRVVKVWAGTHQDIPTSTPLFQDGEEPERPPVGTRIKAGGQMVEIIDGQPDGKHFATNPYVVVARVIGQDGETSGWAMLPRDFGLLVYRVAVSPAAAA